MLHKLTVRAREAFYFTPVMLRKTRIEREGYRKVCTRICGAVRRTDSLNALYVKVKKSLLYWLIMNYATLKSVPCLTALCATACTEVLFFMLIFKVLVVEGQ